jgi:hypothetical protein
MEQQALKLRADATPFVPKAQNLKLNANAQEFKPSTYSSYYSTMLHQQFNTYVQYQAMSAPQHTPPKVKVEELNKTIPTPEQVPIPKSQPNEGEIKKLPEAPKQEAPKMPEKVAPTVVEEKKLVKSKIISYTTDYLRTFRSACRARPFHMKEINIPLLKWKPPENEDKQVVIIKEVRNILNKISKSNYKEMCKQIANNFPYTPIVLEELSKILFNKAVKEANYVDYYMELCDMLFKKYKAPSMNFRKMFVSRCQFVFEGGKDEELEKFKDIDEEEKRVKHKSRLMGNIRLIGELFIRGALTEDIVLICISKFTSANTEENTENLCQLYKKIGKAIYQFTAFNSGQTSIKKRPKIKTKKLTKTLFDDYLDKLIELKKSDQLSSRIKFMIQDTIELRDTEWAQVFDEFVVKENDSNKIVFHAKIKTPTKDVAKAMDPLTLSDPKVEMRELRKNSLNETNILGIDLEIFGKVKLDEVWRLKANNYIDEYIQTKSIDEARTALSDLLKIHSNTHIWIGFFIMYANSKVKIETTIVFNLLATLSKQNSLTPNDIIKG